MHRTLIVARVDPRDTDAVAEVFAESDATALPARIGVTGRTLFRFHGLYFHLVEADEDIRRNLYAHRDSALYQDVNTKLSRFVSPYDPDWKEPADAMATPFYRWTAQDGRLR
ncbi:TcmI family type II polyketide cyclase [Saccharothrix violaceirubra]|uniref:Cyclase n=1 Tax=Saccharothrix violaceirubra TaxID=413306 RepID=A0A7W7SZ76_9PSEU|nr:TcmI family type II polyketide cyclase [Saccharothrix violaceirubra]MBB4963386.1 cyclase [Saccharothrix violaceirubra]